MMTSRIKLLYRCEIPASTHKVWLWHLRRYSTDVFTPANPRLEILKRRANLTKGTRLAFKFRLFQALALSLIFEHLGNVPFRSFSERMVKGPLHVWKHERRFLPWKESATMIEDHIELEFTRYAWLNRYLHPLLEKKLDRLFRWRHHALSFNLKLWQEWPFADQVNVIGVSNKTAWLTQRLRAQLEPIPIQDYDPHKLTTHHGHIASVLNAIGYTKPVLSHLSLEHLRKSHPSVLICFYDQKNPPWLKVLEAYADQIVWVHVQGLVNPYQWFFWPSKQEKWCSEEDLLSLVFQVLHERKGYGKWHYTRREVLKNSYRNFLSTNLLKLSKEKNLSFFKTGLLHLLKALESVVHPANQHPCFKLKITPWKSFKDWKKVCFRV